MESGQRWASAISPFSYLGFRICFRLMRWLSSEPTGKVWMLGIRCLRASESGELDPSYTEWELVCRGGRRKEVWPGKMEQQLWETSQSRQATGWCHRAACCSLWADLAFHLFGNALKLEKEFTSSKSVKTSKEEQFVICENYAQFKFRFHKVLIFMMKNFVKSFLSLLLHNYVHYVFKFSSWCQKLWFFYYVALHRHTLPTLSADNLRMMVFSYFTLATSSLPGWKWPPTSHPRNPLKVEQATFLSYHDTP